LPPRPTTHCPRGHEYGTYEGRKRCRLCERKKDKEYRERNRAKRNEATRHRRAQMTEEQKEQKRANEKAWRNANPERYRELRRRSNAKRASNGKSREYRLKRKFGMSAADLRAMIAHQGACCAICRDPFSELPSHLMHVDHCHEGGAVRGLLCGRCNVMLGMARDSAEYLRAAAAYLESAWEASHTDLPRRRISLLSLGAS
jgi:hypothetical protein